MPEKANVEQVGVLAVLVLYRCSLEESVTWRSLLAQVDSQLRTSLNFHLLVCDNGPLRPEAAITLLPDWVEYVGARENRGLAWAYNLGLARARECGAEWVLTLDQDTALPPDFLKRIVSLAQQASSDVVAAIVPQLVSERGEVHSPVLAGIAGERMIARGFQGIASGEVRPFNSAALVRAPALEAIGGYDRRFWMNYLDHAVFHSLQSAGFTVWVAGDLQIQHHLSLHEGRDHMSEQHFRHFSAAESAFRDLHASWLEGALFTGRLFLRALNQKRRGDPAHFLHATLTVLKARLLLGRKARIRRWEAEVATMAAEPSIAFELRGSVANTNAGPIAAGDLS